MHCIPISTVLVGALCLCCSASACDDVQPTKGFKETVAPILAKYCVTCHGGSEPKGDLTLDSYVDDRAAEKDRGTWERVKEMLDLGEMPPKGKPRPTEAE